MLVMGTCTLGSEKLNRHSATLILMLHVFTVWKIQIIIACFYFVEDLQLPVLCKNCKPNLSAYNNYFYVVICIFKMGRLLIFPDLYK
jgi:hypothetical protein